MVFNSIIFLFYFMPIVIFSFTAVPLRFKRYILLCAGICFYAWSGLDNIKFILLLILVNYSGAILIKRYRKSYLLALFVGVNVMLLIYFKYFNYLIDNINDYLSLQIPLMEVLIPLGISFIIFHAISFQVDSYKDEALFDVDIIDFSVYLLYFPKLIQGPIIMFKDFIPQLKKPNINLDKFTFGIERFIIGLAKKVILADTLLVTVNQAVQSMHTYGIDIYTYWFIAFAYFWVIYLDFSGYSDMALGLSDMLGFSFKENFHYPYTAISITDFWRRWHISLGAWFRTYVYIPLGGNRKGNVYLHLLIVFILTGMWHGAGIMYLLWGLLHGIFILIERFLMKHGLLEKIPSVFRWGYTMAVVMLGWLIFLFPRANKLIAFIKGMIGINTVSYIPFTITYYLSFKIIITILLTVFLSYITAVPLIRKTFRKYNENSLLFNIAKYTFLSALLIYSIMGVVSGNYSPFIYFQF